MILKTFWREQESESFDRPRQDAGVGKEMYEKLQRQSKNREFEIKSRRYYKTAKSGDSKTKGVSEIPI